MIKITDEAKGEILYIASTNPRKIGLKFSTWSLRSIAGYVKEKKLIKDGISHTAIRDILIEKGVEWRYSKTFSFILPSGGWQKKKLFECRCIDTYTNTEYVRKNF